MSDRIDAVLSHHMNPHTCGVAKFNHRLARELGVPCDEIHNASRYQHPLVSVKPEEMAGGVPTPTGQYDLFLHGVPMVGSYMGRPARVYAANGVIARRLRHHWPHIIDAWCPSTIEGNPTRGTINVLTFGMAHKLQVHRYEKLKALLDSTGEDYTVSVSTAVHEGSPWDETASVGDRLRSVFGSALRVLGYLADDALARELRDCTAVAAFFDPAFRANNTSAWAVLEAGKPLITNVDDSSPRANGLFNIEAMNHWPDFDRVANYMVMGQIDAGKTFGWDRLVGTIQGQTCAT